MSRREHASLLERCVEALRGLERREERVVEIDPRRLAEARAAAEGLRRRAQSLEEWSAAAQLLAKLDLAARGDLPEEPSQLLRTVEELSSVSSATGSAAGSLGGSFEEEMRAIDERLSAARRLLEKMESSRRRGGEGLERSSQRGSAEELVERLVSEIDEALSDARRRLRESSKGS